MNYQTVVTFDPALRDVWFTDSDTIGSAFAGLVWNAIKVTTGAPAATAGKFIRGAIVQNAVDGTSYMNTGTTASPTWTLIDTAGAGGITQLTGDVTAGPGNGSQAATIANNAVTTAKINNAAVTGAKLVTVFGLGSIARQTNGTTPVNVFGPTLPFSGTVDGIFVCSNDTTAGNITISNDGNVVATIAKGTSAGVLTGATSLANTSMVAGTPFTIVSDSAGDVTCYITFRFD